MKEKLLKELKKYEGKWVALLGQDEDMEVVAVGFDALEANQKASEKGYKETTLFKVLPSNVAYVPFA